MVKKGVNSTCLVARLSPIFTDLTTEPGLVSCVLLISDRVSLAAGVQAEVERVP